MQCEYLTLSIVAVPILNVFRSLFHFRCLDCCGAGAVHGHQGHRCGDNHPWRGQRWKRCRGNDRHQEGVLSDTHSRQDLHRNTLCISSANNIYPPMNKFNRSSGGPNVAPVKNKVAILTEITLLAWVFSCITTIRWSLALVPICE